MVITIHIYILTGIFTTVCAAFSQKLKPEGSLCLFGKNRLQKEQLPGFAGYAALAAASAMPFIILSSFRFDVGTDYFYTYRPMYDYLADGLVFGKELSSIGRTSLFTLIFKLGGGHVWFFLTTSCIIVVLFFWGIYRQSEIPAASVALFILTEAFFISMNGVMQYVGLAFVFFAFYYVEKQSLWKYALLTLIGSFFHISTIIMLPLYLLSKIKIKPYFGLAAVGLFSLLNAPMLKLFSWLVAKTPYAHYVGSDFQRSERFYPARIVIHGLVVCAAVYFYYKNSNDKKPMYRFCYYVELIALFLTLNRNIFPLTDRVLWSLEIVQILFIPMLISSAKDKRLKIIVGAVLMGAWAVVCYHEIVNLHHHGVLPYRFVYFPEYRFY